jgi:hypothetical protein
LMTQKSSCGTHSITNVSSYEENPEHIQSQI